jgi:MFS transporter, DHA2 family, multidrug resistance protein
MTGPDTNTQNTRPAVTTHPLLGIAGVLLGALIATCTGRLMSAGLADMRGALHLGVDEGSWVNTAFDASMMFIGPLSVYLGGLLGVPCGGFLHVQSANSVSAGHCCTS